ncbi:hypothetical protein AAMO2058_001240200 [Amorphochlora amoebiformis]
MSDVSEASSTRCGCTWSGGVKVPLPLILVILSLQIIILATVDSAELISLFSKQKHAIFLGPIDSTSHPEPKNLDLPAPKTGLASDNLGSKTLGSDFQRTLGSEKSAGLVSETRAARVGEGKEESRVERWLNLSLTHSVAPEGYAFNRPFETLEQLRMCEASQGGPKQRSLTCPEDATCIRCIKDDEKKVADLVIEAYKNPKQMELRRRKFAEWFPNASGNNTIVLIATNERFYPMARNFACASDARKLGGSKNLVIFASDMEAARKASSDGYQALYPEWYGLRQPLKNDFVETMIGMVAAICDLTHAGYNVIVQDADVVWLKSPKFLLTSKHLWAMDILFQIAPRWDAQGVANTGFIVIRNTAKTRVYLRSLLECTPLFFLAGDDQVTFLYFLMHKRKDKSRREGGGRFFELFVPPDGKGGTIPWIDNDSFILHTVADSPYDKVRRMMDARQWYVHRDGKCADKPIKENVRFQIMPKAALDYRKSNKTSRMG